MPEDDVANTSVKTSAAYNANERAASRIRQKSILGKFSELLRALVADGNLQSIVD